MKLFPRIVVGLFVLHISTCQIMDAIKYIQMLGWQMYSPASLHQHPTDCSKYTAEIPLRCPHGSHFNKAKGQCDSIEAANCSPLVKDMSSMSTQQTTPGGQNVQDEGNDVYNSNIIASADKKCKRIVCYFESERMYAHGNLKLYPRNLKTSQCTHIIWASALIVKEIRVVPSQLDDPKYFKEMMDLKQSNPDLKVLIAIGGRATRPQTFVYITSSKRRREIFIDRIITFIRRYNFDGLSVDWLLPQKEDKAQHAILMKEFRTAFHKEWLITKTPRLLLTSLLFMNINNMNDSYDVPALNQYLDFFHLFNFNLAPGNKRTGYHSPLLPLEAGDKNNIHFLANNFIKLGASKDKLVIGIPLFGNFYTLESPSNSSVGAPVSGSNKSPHTGMYGKMAYYEYCSLLTKTGVKKYNISTQQARYLVDGDQWLGYEDKESIANKINYVLSKDFGGVMIYSINFDDFWGKCNDGKFPIMRRVAKECRMQRTPDGNNVKGENDSSNNNSDRHDKKCKRIVCYFDSGRMYTKHDAKLLPYNINAKQCTHIIWASASLNNHRMTITRVADPKHYQQMMNLKKSNPNLKVLIAVGRNEQRNHTWSTRSYNQRRHFGKSSIPFIRKYGFDGLNLDWRLPNDEHKAKNVTLILKQLRIRFRNEALRNKKPTLLLTMSIYTKTHDPKLHYDMREMNQYVDFFHLHIFNLAPGNHRTGHISPLFPLEYGDKNNIQSVTNRFKNMGASHDKLVLGIHLFGNLYTLESPSNFSVGAPVSNTSISPRSKMHAKMAYYEYCPLLTKTGVMKYQILPQHVPYLVDGDQWLGYEDKESITKKINYVLSKDFGGVMIWSLNFDDFLNECKQGKFPMMKAVNEACGV